jgi:hypothetical protein
MDGECGRSEQRPGQRTEVFRRNGEAGVAVGYHLGHAVGVGAARRSGPGSLIRIEDKFDVSWVDRIQGKLRAVFDSPEISEGAALFRAMAWCDEYKSVCGTPRSEMSPVLVVPSS